MAVEHNGSRVKVSDNFRKITRPDLNYSLKHVLRYIVTPLPRDSGISPSKDESLDTMRRMMR